MSGFYNAAKNICDELMHYHFADWLINACSKYQTREQIGLRNSGSQIRCSLAQCQINDNEARVVQRLVLDLMGQSEVMDEWMDAIIDRYFRGQSWSEMVREDRSQSDVRSDVKCGLAVLHVDMGLLDTSLARFR